MKLAEHSCGDSRLTCNDCQGPVCPKCMVECPVGLRCKKCAGKIKSHVLQVSPAVIAKTVVAAAVVGFLSAYVTEFGGMGFYGWFIIYFVGMLTGDLIHKISGYKLGSAIIATVVVGLLAGMFANPITFRSYGMSNELAAIQNQVRSAKYSRARQTQSSKEANTEIQKNNPETTKSEQATTPVAQDPASSQPANIDPEDDDSPEAAMTPQTIALTQQHFQSMQMWTILKLAIFIAGVLTPFTGIVPPIPLPFFRR